MSTQTTPEAAAAATPPHVPVIPGPRFFFTASLLAGLFALAWTILVIGMDATQPFDDRCVNFWSQWSSAHRDFAELMYFCTDLGSFAAMTVLALMGALWQSAIKHRVLAAAWLGVVVGGAFLNMVAKESIRRDRPDAAKREHVVHETNFSYPSGHAMGSAVGYGMLAYALILPQRHRPRRLAAILLMLAITFAVGFSRMYLRAHYFSDVIAGWACGLCWLFFCLGWLERHRRRKVQ